MPNWKFIFDTIDLFESICFYLYGEEAVALRIAACISAKDVKPSDKELILRMCLHVASADGS